MPQHPQWRHVSPFSFESSWAILLARIAFTSSVYRGILNPSIFVVLLVNEFFHGFFCDFPVD